jgi:hypothetical protein
VRAEGYVVGFRAWGVRTGDLLSTGTPFRWRSREMKASCWYCSVPRPAGVPPGHDAPVLECGCGIHALLHLERAVELGPVVGVVTGWGRVIHHGSEGWRSEYARIIALASVPERAGAGGRGVDSAMVTATYGVPFTTLDALVLVAREHASEEPGDGWAGEVTRLGR